MDTNMETSAYEQFLADGLKVLCEQNEYCKKECRKFLSNETFSKADIKDVLSILSKLLLQPDTTLLVATCFPQMVLELLSLSMDKAVISNEEKFYERTHQQMCVSLGKLVRLHPDAVRFSLRYFENNPAPFDKSNEKSVPIPKRRKLAPSSHVKITDLDIVLCCYNFLQVACEHFRQLWDWSMFLEMYVGHKEDQVCWVACQCIAWVTGMSDAERHGFLSNYLSEEVLRECLLVFDELHIEGKRRTASLVGNQSNIQLGSDHKMISESVVTISGIQLPVFNPKLQKNDGCLVPVPSTSSNLHSLALAVASGRAICLQGPVGCGKTALVEHLAQLTGRTAPPHFIKVQLGDQTDSKMLLGTYRCTDIPGEFVWQPGVLTQAIIGGHWLLLEDIDTAAMDVASVLASLLETGSLTVPGYRDSVKVSPGFQLFVTQRLLTGVSGFQRQISGASSLLEKLWLLINVEPLSKSELVQIVQTMFPALNTVAERIVKVFLLFSVGKHDSGPSTEERSEQDSDANLLSITRKSGRLISTRDLIKWCTRAVEGFDSKSQESTLKIYQDAIDIFCCSINNEDTRVQLAAAIGSCLGIIRTKAEYFCKMHKPNISMASLTFIAGSAVLPRQAKDVARLSSATRSSFSFTRQAACLLERVARCVSRKEPVLLVGETGTGKTTIIQYLAECTNHRLVVINMNQQSDSADLLGGYKPVDLKYVAAPVREEFEKLFRDYFSVSHNAKFLNNISVCFNSRRWTTLVRLMKQSYNAALRRLTESPDEKRRSAWQHFGNRLLKLETQVNAKSALAFAFIEGSLVKALQEGYWVLLDEINLASAETLQCLSGLLEGSGGSLYLLERGDSEPIKRHPEFQLFACMNPATDVGKKDLPAGLRNRFTEFFVDELTEHSELYLLVGSYLRDLSLPDAKLEKIVRFYLNIRKEASLSLADGTGHKPHYSLRTLCRALSVAACNPCASSQRSLFEAMCLSFLTQLNHTSHPAVMMMIAKAVLGVTAISSVLKQPIPQPKGSASDKYVSFEGYWVLQGNVEPKIPEKYILTPSVRRNLHDLVRVVSIGHHPVLLQGETSVGKTSLITYLAQASGNHCVRINNHEHTDLQEYVGSYCADENGHLVFREGVLVEAMRKGHWIILDELNLAPTDVLEALNRVLDDNRELFIPETQETVKADPRFMLFATQNPPGQYGGRKMLSRAFRNRFVELHFAEIPPVELETILQKRCDMPPSYCKKLVVVMTELQIHRRESAAFAGKEGFMTLRDLFRWGERYRLANQVTGKYYDWDQHLADEGYLVLAGRVRKEEECKVIQEALKKHIKRTVDPESLFTLSDKTSPVTRDILEKLVSKPVPGFEHVVWTFNMRRLAVLVGKAFIFEEPVLLVGETGCGKTTICQLLASIQKQVLHTVNCHMHTESSDFLGGLRPVREHSDVEGPQKLFEWVDGPLITAMQTGNMFLADEISLADDSVLERLNSLLEPERTLLLAEKGTDGLGTDQGDSSCVVVAQEAFRFVGTMNPGGDYGKKELSPALRNRFTEVWCVACSQRADLLAVIEHNIRPGLSLGNQEDGTSGVGNCMLDFIQWFKATEVGKRFPVNMRDILSWVNFINVSTEGTSQLDIGWAYVHGACLTFLDSFGSGVTSVDSSATLKTLNKLSLNFLMEQMKLGSDTSFMEVKVVVTDDQFGIHPFYISRGKFHPICNNFSFDAPTTGLNALRVMRALQLNKPILLEGSPGVGKTSLVAALAKASSHKLVRINVSDQTDVSDLFGADLPVEGGEGGQFAWRDGPFLQALKAGDWILLDELNLATQSVLEGLNACLDHRGEIFVPELGRTFHVQPGRTHLFGAQNPLRQGGARRGLPQSFLNRFTQVYIDALSDADLELILVSLYPNLAHDLVVRIVQFNSRLAREIGELKLWGHRGSPWELNLRDLCRWCQALTEDKGIRDSGSDDLEDIDMTIETGSGNGTTLNPGRYVGLIYVDRMRTRQDKEKVKEIYCEEFGEDYPLCCDTPRVHVARDMVFVGDVALSRNAADKEMDKPKSVPPPCVCPPEEQLLLLRKQFPTLQSLAKCVNMNWLSILVGPSASGKTSAVRLLSQLAGRELKTLSINSAMDTTEILGGFEQADYNRHLEEAASRIERLLLDSVRRRLVSDGDTSAPRDLLRQFETFRKLSMKDVETLAEETQLFYQRLSTLQEIIKILPASGLSASLLPELKDIEQKLDCLSGKLKKEDGLNAGGKFEWVDSILVKCLQEGCWLLMDGVNLCSPAVLDRLNALLEPEGVLTIGERGVGPSGELVTIKPHPNFRLFLAMDPKHGEISRAMRNRGVEICLLEEEHYNNLDIAALMANVGLTQYEEQQALLAVHQAMTEVWQDLDELGISHLLHAAFLISQQTSRGHGPYEAFLSSCRDVYVKSHSRSLSGSTAGSSVMKQKLYQTMSEALSVHREKLETRNNQECLENCLPLYDSTIRTAKLQENSMFASLKQEGGLLVSVLDALLMSKPLEGDPLENLHNSVVSPSTEYLNHVLDIKSKDESVETNVNLTEILPYLLLIFFERSTLNDTQLRHEWLIRHVRKCIAKSSVNQIDLKDCFSFVLKMSSSLKDTLHKFLSSSVAITSFLEQVCPSRDLPWDLRWLPEVMAANCSPADSDTIEYVRVTNTLSLLCYFTFLKKVEEISKIDISMPVKHKPVTILEYSSAVTERKLSDDVTNHPLVVLFAPFLRQLDAQIINLLGSDHTLLSSDKWKKLLPALAWRFHFGEQGSIQLVGEAGRKSRSLDLTIDTLSIHYKWICKHLLPKLQDLLEQNTTLLSSKNTKKLLSTVDNINASIASSISPFLAIGKRVRRFIGQPLPFPTEELGNLTSQVYRLSAALQVWPDLDPTHSKKQSLRVLFLLSSKGRKARNDLIAAVKLLKTGSRRAVEEAQLLIDHVEKQIISADLLTDTSSDKGIPMSKESLTNCAMVKLWPFQELLSLLLSAAFMREVFQFRVNENNGTPCENISPSSPDSRIIDKSKQSTNARQLAVVLENLASVPPVLVGLAGQHSVITASDQQCVLELLMWHLKHNALSPARSFSQRWLTWNPAEDVNNDSVAEVMNTMESSEDSFPLHCPLLTELVTGLTLKDYPSGSSSVADLVATSSLGSQQTSRHILRTLQELMWRNIATLTSPELDYKLNDAQCAAAVLQHLMQGLREALSDVDITREEVAHSPMEELVSKLHSCISEMEEFPVLEVNHFIEALRKLAVAADSLKRDKNSELEILLSTGEIWTLLGYVQITLFSKFGTYDPVKKKALKLQYATEEHKDIARILYAHELQASLMGRSLDDYSDSNLHPLILLHRYRLDWLTDRKKILAQNVAFRPSDRPYFQELKKETQHYSGSLGSSEVVLGFHRRLFTACQDFIAYFNQSQHVKQQEKNLSKAAEDVLREERSWRQSQIIFSERVSKTYGVWYPDLVTPFLAAVAQLCHGTSLLASVLNKLLLQLKLQSSEPMMFNLVRFPAVGAGQESILHLVETCGDPALVQLMNSTLKFENKELYTRQETYRLMQSALQELRNHTILQSGLDEDIWNKFAIILAQVVTAWRKQEDERLAQEAEKDNLFVTKGGTRCKTVSEEEEAALEIEQLFPTTMDEDFGDLQIQPTLESTPITPKLEPQNAAVGLISSVDIQQICQLHFELVTSFSRSAWLAPMSVGVQPDFVTPLLLRYRTFSVILSVVSRGMSSTLDKRLAPSLVLLTSIALNVGKSSEMSAELPMPGSPSRQSKTMFAKKTSDFYRDSNPGEVRQCLPLLQSVKQRVQELLDQWPDHPTLSQIMKILERIQDFPVTSPVARFLTGLELLLTKMQEWEENAHSGVSLAPHSAAVTHQIIAWRKLELQCWKDCLTNATLRAKANASHWWFHIYSVVESFTKPDTTHKDTPMTEQDLIHSLQRFMEESTLGEFQARLDILYGFHCHTIHMEPSRRRDELMSILWNLHGYYSQFSDGVNARIRELRLPVEKKLKDFVKIARWNDINYWAVKAAVEKTHKTLHKHIKEFEDVLKQPAIGALTNPKTESSNTEISEGLWDRPQRHQPRQYHHMLDPLHFVAHSRLKRFITTDKECKDMVLLSRARSMFSKACKLSKETILASSYPRLMQTVDSFVTEIIETSNQLKNLEVSKDLSKEKQKSQAKSFLQQKRKALADLFRVLQQMGLSYRTGTALWNAEDNSVTNFLLPPMDLKAAFQYLKNRRPDGQLLNVWDGCETYFLRSVARLALLNTALQNPSKDLGPPAIERCRGFAAHLMIVSREQKKKLAESSKLLCSLRCLIAQLTAMEENDDILPRQSELQQSWKCLKELLVTSIVCLEQFRIFLQACPSGSVNDVEIPVLELKEGASLPPMITATKNDEVWESSVKKVKHLILSITKLRTVMAKSETNIPFEYPDKDVGKRSVTEGTESASKLNTNILITPCQYAIITEGFEQVEKYADELKSLQMMFESSYDRTAGDDSTINPMVDSLHWLEHTIRQEVATFREKNASFLKSPKQTLRDETPNSSVSNEEEELEQDSDLLVSESTEMNDNETVKSNITDAVVHDQGKIVPEFSSKCEKLLKSVLIVIQNMYKKYTVLTEKTTDTKASETESKENVADTREEGQQDVEKSDDNEEEDSDKIEDGHMKEKIVESISADLDLLNMKAINSQIQNLIHNLVSILDTHNAAKEGNICKRILLSCIPCLDQLVLLCQFFVTQQVAAYRVSCKMLSVLLSVFLDLAEKGFCVPPELAEGAEGDQTEGTQGGMGLGEGEGEKDVSETIESEDQLEDARPQGEERKEEDRDCKEEEKGIETSEDFGGKVQDLEKKEGDEGESEESGEEEELDKEMGETEEGADMLDQQIWGSDSEGEGSDEDGEEEDKKEDGGSGEKTGEKELGAKDEKDKYSPEDEDEKEDGRQEKQKKDIDEMKEPEMDEDHVDPYHGNQQPLPEPEPLDLPDDLQLDDGDAKDGQEDEENPFDIDAMKEKKPPEAEGEGEEQESTEEKQESKKETEHDSSDEEEEEDGNDAEEAPGVKDPDDDEKMETEGPDENEDEADGGGKDDEKDRLEPKETEKEEEKEDRKQLEAVPSDDRPSDAPAEAAPDMKGGSKDKVTPHPDQAPNEADEDMGSEGGDEAEGVGQAETEEDKTGHRGQLPNQRDNLPSQNSQPEADQLPEKRRRPGETDSNRTLGDVSEPVKKKLKTIDLPKKDGQENEEMEEDKEETEERKTDRNVNAEEYQHIKDAKETHDTQTLDAATKEQAEKQSVPKLEDEPAEDPSPDENMELQEDKPQVPEEHDIPSQKSEKVPGRKKKEGDERDTGDVDAEGEVEARVEVEGESVPTLGAARGSETTYHTSHDKMMSDTAHLEEPDVDPVAVRNELEKQLATWAQPPPDDEAAKAWESFLAVTSSLARDLSEQLRLVLEPTQASRLRGDYRTGRRINMRKVIPYIASQFRKDKIWLRRTKPSKRDYQIVLAIDDSASMADNHSKELAFESLALVSRALTLLESGELSVISFGEMVKVLHQLGDPFTEQSGARLLQQISFAQNGTRVAQLVEFVTAMFQMSKSRASHSSDLAQLLVIVSDGRGVFSESPNKVKLAIRQAREAHIFMVFIIVDNPDNQSSILDIRTPVFKDGKLECFKPYLDSFPFPFYLILRDINALPGVLSDALRQWFELVTNMDSH